MFDFIFKRKDNCDELLDKFTVCLKKYRKSNFKHCRQILHDFIHQCKEKEDRNTI